MNTQSKKPSMMERFLALVDYRNTIISDMLEEEIPDSAYEDKEHMLEVLMLSIIKSQQQLIPNI